MKIKKFIEFIKESNKKPDYVYYYPLEQSGIWYVDKLENEYIFPYVERSGENEILLSKSEGYDNLYSCILNGEEIFFEIDLIPEIEFNKLQSFYGNDIDCEGLRGKYIVDVLDIKQLDKLVRSNNQIFFIGKKKEF